MFHAHTVLCSLCTLIPGSLAHATVVKYGGVNKSNGLDLLPASQQLNRTPQGNEGQAAIMGNMEMSVFYKVDKDWEAIVLRNLQERFYLQIFTVQPLEENDACSRWSLGPHYKYAKHPSPIFQSSTLAAAGQFHKMFESSEFSRSLEGRGGGYLDPHVRKRRMNLWMKQEKPEQMLLSSTVVNGCQGRVHLQPHILCRRHEWKIPRSYIPCQAANFCQSGRRSRCPRERAWVREGGYSLADPTAGAGQSSSSACLQFPDIDLSKVSLVGKLSRRRHTSVHFSQ